MVIDGCRFVWSKAIAGMHCSAFRVWDIVYSFDGLQEQTIRNMSIRPIMASGCVCEHTKSVFVKWIYMALERIPRCVGKKGRLADLY